MDLNNRSGQWIRQHSNYKAFIPKKLPPDPPLVIDDKMIRLLSDADHKLGRLDGLTQVLPNPELFVAMYVQKEAVLSSQIEGTQASLVDVLQIEQASGDKRLEIEEVVNYVKAVNWGMARIESLPLSLRLIREIHGVLLDGVRGANKEPGEFRRSQNWIGPAGCTLTDASFVPPPPSEMHIALSDLEKYMHEDGTLPKLIQIALIHAQFETIHPFLDGNGRIGRLLITFWLFQQRILNYPLLYISYYFKKHRMEYYDRLNNVRMYGQWEEWVQFFLKAIAETADSATKCGREIILLKDHLVQEIQESLKGKGYGIKMLDYLFHHPIIQINDIKSNLSISYPTAKSLVDSFCEMGILEPIDKQRSRNKTYQFSQYVKMLSEGTEL